MNPARSFVRRMVAKMQIGDGCWLWTGAKNNMGYGQLWDGTRVQYAHRLVYQLLSGPIPEGRELDHLCRTPSCVRPDHLEPVTHRENVVRGTSLPAQRAHLTHCKYGHPFDADNTQVRRDGDRIRRACRECMRIKARLYKARFLARDPEGWYEAERRRSRRAYRKAKASSELNDRRSSAQ